MIAILATATGMAEGYPLFADGGASDQNVAALIPVEPYGQV